MLRECMVSCALLVLAPGFMQAQESACAPDQVVDAAEEAIRAMDGDVKPSTGPRRVVGQFWNKNHDKVSYELVVVLGEDGPLRVDYVPRTASGFFSLKDPKPRFDREFRARCEELGKSVGGQSTPDASTWQPATPGPPAGQRAGSRGREVDDGDQVFGSLASTLTASQKAELVEFADTAGAQGMMRIAQFKGRQWFSITIQVQSVLDSLPCGAAAWARPRGFFNGIFFTSYLPKLRKMNRSLPLAGFAFESQGFSDHCVPKPVVIYVPLDAIEKLLAFDMTDEDLVQASYVIEEGSRRIALPPEGRGR